MYPVNDNLTYNCSKGLLVDCSTGCNLTELWYCGFTYGQHYEQSFSGSSGITDIRGNKIIMALIIFMISTFALAA